MNNLEIVEVNEIKNPCKQSVQSEASISLKVSIGSVLYDLDIIGEGIYVGDVFSTSLSDYCLFSDGDKVENDQSIISYSEVVAIFHSHLES